LKGEREKDGALYFQMIRVKRGYKKLILFDWKGG